jgi:transposase
MNELTRNEIIRLWYGRASIRRIAKMLAINRKTVDQVLKEHKADRKGAGAVVAPPRPSIIDPFRENIAQLLERYPDITAVRLHEELKSLGFPGAYSTVKERLRDIKPRSKVLPVVRVETGPGVQSQMDYSPYEIDFTEEGRRKVHAFSYILSHSRRQYLHFTEHEDFTTTIREHQRAFSHNKGLAATCLYDSFKVVVTTWDGEQPIYNTRFLAFATHYGFKPWACRRRRPQTKGKIERPFGFVETNLLNARKFRSRAHLNEVTAWWLANVSDVHMHRETKRRPIDLYQEELPYLLPLPEHDYDTAIVLYRIVNVEGFVAYLQNFYSVPWERIGEALPVRVTENELIVYGPDIVEIARHELYPATISGQKRENKSHRPGADDRLIYEVLKQRFEELVPQGGFFLERLVQTRRYGKDEANRILSLQASYSRKDLGAAIERASRYRAFSLAVIERILAAQAQPRAGIDYLENETRNNLRRIGGDPVPPRSTAEYQKLLEDKETEDERAAQCYRNDDEGDDVA